MCAWPIAVISCAASRCAARAARRGSRAPRPRRAVARVPRVAEAVELAQQLAAPRVVDARLVLSAAQHVEVARQRPRLGVEARELAALERGTAARPAPARWGCGWSSRPAEQPVAGDLDAARSSALARRRARRRASRRARTCAPPLTRPCTGSPSSHSVASEFVTSSRSTRSPAHAAGTRRLDRAATTSPTAGRAPSPSVASR